MITRLVRVRIILLWLALMVCTLLIALPSTKLFLACELGLSSPPFPQLLHPSQPSQLPQLLYKLLNNSLASTICLKQIIIILSLNMLLIIQFRLWDDLADRVYDMRAHPQRTLLLGHSRQCFTAVCAVLFIPIASLLAIYFDAHQLFAYFGLLASMAVLYSRPLAQLPRLLRTHLVLLKYPIFIYLSATQIDLPHWLYIAAILYLLLNLFEIASDAQLRQTARWRSVAIIEAFLCSILLFL